MRCRLIFEIEHRQELPLVQQRQGHTGRTVAGLGVGAEGTADIVNRCQGQVAMARAGTQFNAHTLGCQLTSSPDLPRTLI